MTKIRHHAPVVVPADLEFFTQLETQAVLRCQLKELIDLGKLVKVNIGGHWLITGGSVRGYIAECAANPRPSGRSLCAKALNADHPASRRRARAP